jgi:hypothetical protein
VTVDFSVVDSPGARLRTTTEFVRQRVLDDVRTSRYQWTGEPLVFRIEDGELVGSAFGGESDFPVHVEDGAETACALTANEVQDGVIDRIGRPWPELLDAEDQFVGVLEIGTPGGIACWVLRGMPFCAVGQLVGAAPAAGYRVR